LEYIMKILNLALIAILAATFVFGCSQGETAPAEGSGATAGAERPSGDGPQAVEAVE